MRKAMGRTIARRNLVPQNTVGTFLPRRPALKNFSFMSASSADLPGLVFTRWR